MRKKFYVVRFSLFIVSYLFINSSFSQVGHLDQTFGIGGIITTDFSGAHDSGKSVVIQNDGKILVGGQARNISDYDFALVRYNDNGTLDGTFGINGKVITDFGSPSDYGRSVALQNDGKIVFAGGMYGGGQTALARYNIDGTLDSLFGIGGKVIFTIGLGCSGESVAIQHDGKIVIGGRSFNGGPSEFSLVRFNNNGNLDSTFGTSGYVSTTVGNYGAGGLAIKIQDDEKILVAGYNVNGTDDDFALVRYNNNGSLDTSFNSNGIVTTAVMNSVDIAYSVTVQIDQKIIVVGDCYCSPNSIALVRYESNGMLDNTFGSGGIVTIHFGSFSGGGNSVKLQGDGKIVISGRSYIVSNFDLALVRLDSNGNLDLSFNNTGYVITDLGGKWDEGASVAIQNDGKIVVAGQKGDSLNSDFAVARYNGDIVDINEIKKPKSEISISPNPTNDNLVVSFNTQIENAKFEIFDITGNVVYNQVINNQRSVVITGIFSPGIYFVSVKHKDEIWTSRFISF